MIDISNIDIFMLIGAITTIASVVFGTKWVKAKNILKEFSHIPIQANKMLEDDNVTTEELKDFLKEVADFIEAVKG